MTKKADKPLSIPAEYMESAVLARVKTYAEKYSLEGVSLFDTLNATDLTTFVSSECNGDLADKLNAVNEVLVGHVGVLHKIHQKTATDKELKNYFRNAVKICRKVLEPFDLTELSDTARMVLYAWFLGVQEALLAIQKQAPDLIDGKFFLALKSKNAEKAIVAYYQSRAELQQLAVFFEVRAKEVKKAPESSSQKLYEDMLTEFSRRDKSGKQPVEDDQIALASLRNIADVQLLGGRKAKCRVVPATPDGNCGFEAISRCLVLAGQPGIASEITREKFIALVIRLQKNSRATSQIQEILKCALVPDVYSWASSFAVTSKKNQLAEEHFKLLSYHYDLKFHIYYLPPETSDCFAPKLLDQTMYEGKTEDKAIPIHIAHVVGGVSDQTKRLNHFEGLVISPTNEQEKIINGWMLEADETFVPPKFQKQQFVLPAISEKFSEDSKKTDQDAWRLRVQDILNDSKEPAKDYLLALQFQIKAIGKKCKKALVEPLEAEQTKLKNHWSNKKATGPFAWFVNAVRLAARRVFPKKVKQLAKVNSKLRKLKGKSAWFYVGGVSSKRTKLQQENTDNKNNAAIKKLEKLEKRYKIIIQKRNKYIGDIAKKMVTCVDPSDLLTQLESSDPIFRRLAKSMKQSLRSAIMAEIATDAAWSDVGRLRKLSAVMDNLPLPKSVLSSTKTLAHKVSGKTVKKRKRRVRKKQTTGVKNKASAQIITEVQQAAVQGLKDLPDVEAIKKLITQDAKCLIPKEDKYPTMINAHVQLIANALMVGDLTQTHCQKLEAFFDSYKNENDTNVKAMVEKTRGKIASVVAALPVNLSDHNSIKQLIRWDAAFLKPKKESYQVTLGEHEKQMADALVADFQNKTQGDTQLDDFFGSYTQEENGFVNAVVRDLKKAMGPAFILAAQPLNKKHFLMGFRDQAKRWTKEDLVFNQVKQEIDSLNFLGETNDESNPIVALVFNYGTVKEKQLLHDKICGALKQLGPEELKKAARLLDMISTYWEKMEQKNQVSMTLALTTLLEKTCGALEKTKGKSKEAQQLLALFFEQKEELVLSVCTSLLEKVFDSFEAKHNTVRGLLFGLLKKTSTKNIRQRYFSMPSNKIFQDATHPDWKKLMAWRDLGGYWIEHKITEPVKVLNDVSNRLEGLVGKWINECDSDKLTEFRESIFWFVGKSVKDIQKDVLQQIKERFLALTDGLLDEEKKSAFDDLEKRIGSLKTSRLLFDYKSAPTSVLEEMLALLEKSILAAVKNPQKALKIKLDYFSTLRDVVETKDYQQARTRINEALFAKASDEILGTKPTSANVDHNDYYVAAFKGWLTDNQEGEWYQHYLFLFDQWNTPDKKVDAGWVQQFKVLLTQSTERPNSIQRTFQQRLRQLLFTPLVAAIQGDNRITPDLLASARQLIPLIPEESLVLNGPSIADELMLACKTANHVDRFHQLLPELPLIEALKRKIQRHISGLTSAADWKTPSAKACDDLLGTGKQYQKAEKAWVFYEQLRGQCLESGETQAINLALSTKLAARWTAQESDKTQAEIEQFACLVKLVTAAFGAKTVLEGVLPLLFNPLKNMIFQNNAITSDSLHNANILAGLSQEDGIVFNNQTVADLEKSCKTANHVDRFHQLFPDVVLSETSKEIVFSFVETVKFPATWKNPSAKVCDDLLGTDDKHQKIATAWELHEKLCTPCLLGKADKVDVSLYATALTTMLESRIPAIEGAADGFVKLYASSSLSDPGMKLKYRLLSLLPDPAMKEKMIRHIETQFNAVDGWDQIEPYQNLCEFSYDYRSAVTAWKGLFDLSVTKENKLNYITFGLYSPIAAFKTAAQGVQVENLRENKASSIADSSGDGINESLPLDIIPTDLMNNSLLSTEEEEATKSVGAAGDDGSFDDSPDNMSETTASSSTSSEDLRTTKSASMPRPNTLKDSGKQDRRHSTASADKQKKRQSNSFFSWFKRKKIPQQKQKRPSPKGGSSDSSE
jgi:hypothetical protein